MWRIDYHPEAKQELKQLDGSQRKIVLKAIIKVSENPKSYTEGGYGKPLGNKSGNNLTGLLKIKLKGLGLRVVYKLEKVEPENIMRIIVISVREDNEVYEIAAKREGR
jgi:mRNA interferase RelE/StbE